MQQQCPYHRAVRVPSTPVLFRGHGHIYPEQAYPEQAYPGLLLHAANAVIVEIIFSTLF